MLIIWRSPFEYTFFRDVEVQPCCGFALSVFAPLAQGADLVESLERAPCGGTRAPARGLSLSLSRSLYFLTDAGSLSRGARRARPHR
jgi:hypothetical protein